jgi:hypothetical protein
VVEPGNTQYFDGAVDFLRTNMKTTDLLRPLFCSNEINLNTGGFGVPSSMVVDDELTGSSQFSNFTAASANNFVNFSAPLDQKVYAKVIHDVGQKVVDDNGNVIGTDTDKGNGTFAFAERSFIDMGLVDALFRKGVIDKPLGRAVLMVDFTNPVFSPIRCGLLTRLGPALNALKSADRNADAIKKAIGDALGANPTAGSAEAQLKANLASKPDDFKADIEGFGKACTDRSKSEADAYTRDIQTVLSLNRSQARARTILEFSATLPRDQFDRTDDSSRIHADTHLDAQTCKLVCARTPCIDP